MNSDDVKICVFLTVIIGILLFVFGSLIFGGMLGNQANNYYKKELKSQDAIIKSPAVIIVCQNYTYFKTIEEPVFFYSGSFYKVPDSYMGYKWTPYYNIIWGDNGWTWELRNP